MPKSFYITTPIYYPNAAPHVGTAYSTIVCDVVARYKRLTGYDVKFLTGVDEHGQKIQEAADKNGYTPQQWVDKMSLNFTTLWEKLNINEESCILCISTEGDTDIDGYRNVVWNGHYKNN